MNVIQRVMRRCSGNSLKSLIFTQKANITRRISPYPREHQENPSGFPRKIFSGIQPTGAIHLGNYLGAIQRWVRLQNSKEDVTFCIVDMHSITLPQNPITLRENVFEMAATLFACGIDPTVSKVFVQSAVPEHSELCWILNCGTTMARLGHLPQFKEKSRKIKDVPLGLYVYPVLQSADIMLYKATHVPVGEDQLQHIQLAQHLTRNFNREYGPTFPVCQALIEQHDAARIRSLRDPSKKMSKSDADPKATINLNDEPEVIVEKFRKAVTDCTSDVTYEPTTRIGVSNLVAIHSLVTGMTLEQVVADAKSLDTGRFKLRVADAVVAHLKPIRERINELLENQAELIHTLNTGAEHAREIAQLTMTDVKQRMGLGAYPGVPQIIRQIIREPTAPSEESRAEQNAAAGTSEDDALKPVVPIQRMRIEKRRSPQAQFKHSTAAMSTFDAGALGNKANDFKPTVIGDKNQSTWGGYSGHGAGYGSKI